MQQRTLLHLLIVGLSTLCAGTLADSGVDSFPYPSAASSAQATVSGDDWYSLLRRNVGQMMEKRAEGIRSEEDVKNLDLENWSEETVKLCAKKLNSTTTTSNPAGVAGCWNIPILVADSGVFAADLRLFRVAEPTGDWINVDVSSYNISLEYDGSAAIQARNLTEKERRASEEGMPKDTKLTKLVDSQFIGNLDQSVLTTGLSEYVHSLVCIHVQVFSWPLTEYHSAELMVMVTPQISIKALTASGKQVSTTINTTDSQFLNGVFADTPSLSADQIEDVQEAPFQLPGTRIEIVPAGLYFFSAYTVVALSIFGWGTLERSKFRDQYRKRIATQGYR
jgi:hypothetical protein